MNSKLRLINSVVKNTRIFNVVNNNINKRYFSANWRIPSSSTTTTIFSKFTLKDNNKSNYSTLNQQQQEKQQEKGYTFNRDNDKINGVKYFSIVTLAGIAVGGSGISLCQERPSTVVLEQPTLTKNTRIVTDEDYEEIVQAKRNKRIVNVAGAAALSGFLGYSAGYATKRIGRIVMYVVGLLFILSQVLSYYGYITIDWRKITLDASPKFTKEKRKDYARRFYHLLTHNLPFKIGFGSGFYLGLVKTK